MTLPLNNLGAHGADADADADADGESGLVNDISIPPVTCTDGAATGAVARKSNAKSFRVTSDDVRRTSLKLPTELIVTHCISPI